MIYKYRQHREEAIEKPIIIRKRRRETDIKTLRRKALNEWTAGKETRHTVLCPLLFHSFFSRQE